MENELIFDIALSYEQTLTTNEKILLYQNFKNSENILNLNINTLRNMLGRKWKGDKFKKECLLKKAESVIKYLKKTYIYVIKYDDPEYPHLLKLIPDFPVLLYCKGSLKYDPNKSMAVVGTRNPDLSGIKRTQKLVEELVEKKYAIISGLAKGIDATAHISCLRNKGKTIAVLGCGIDMIYPEINKETAKKILNSNGALISEYPPGIRPERWNFPRRNRIIVGLSRAVLITQSPGKSGTLISAKLAADYNRDLFVCAYNENSAKDAGNKELILTGAKEINTSISITDELTYDYI